jgi:hypothetical protein
MDALSASPTAATATPLPQARPVATPVPAEVPSPAHAAVAEALPPLPAAVQRTQLEPPAAKLMTREEMAALLALTT